MIIRTLRTFKDFNDFKNFKDFKHFQRQNTLNHHIKENRNFNRKKRMTILPILPDSKK